MSPRDVRRSWLLVGYVIGDLAITGWYFYKEHKRSREWDKAVREETDKAKTHAEGEGAKS